MDNQPSLKKIAELRDTAFQLKNAADIVLAEVQHIEAAQQRFAQKAQAKTKALPDPGGAFLLGAGLGFGLGLLRETLLARPPCAALRQARYRRRS